MAWKSKSNPTLSDKELQSAGLPATGQICRQCIRTFQPTVPVVPEFGFHLRVPFHNRPWELLKKSVNSDACVMCTFFMAVITSRNMNSAATGTAIRDDRKIHLGVNKFRILTLHRDFEEQCEGYSSYRVTVSEINDRKIINPLPITLSIYKSDDPRIKLATPINQSSLTTSSDSSFETLFCWQNRCLAEHESCRRLGQRHENDKSWLPTRLIRIVAGTGETPCSIHLVENIQPEKATNLQYSTLSYCWGKFPLLKLLKANIQNFKTNIAIDTLPNTFKDAMAACQRLGIEYLWIDALCIVQDSAEDWIRESAMMSKVYSYSCLTLAAAASQDSNGGLFRDRNPSLVNGVKFQIAWDDYAQGEFQCLRCDPWLEFVRDSPLLKRAWVFQERLLSPRTVYFASDQLYWECGELYASELFPKGGPWDLDYRQRKFDTATRLPKGLEPSNDGRLKHNYSSTILQVAEPNGMTLEQMIPYLWSNIICEYSNGDLTFEKDKLIAILGVATSVTRFVGNDTYFAGSWQSDLPLYLLWSRQGKHGRLQEYQAPSWSWASMATNVRMDLLFRALEHPTIKIQILNNELNKLESTIPIEATDQIAKHTIKVKGSLCKVTHTSRVRISLTGPLSKYFWNRSLIGKSNEYTFIPCQTEECLIFRGKGLATRYPSRFVFDEEEEKDKEIFCLQVVTGTQQHPWGKVAFVAGIMLQSTGIKGQFCRVGYFEIVPEMMRRSWRASGRVGGLGRKSRAFVEAALFEGGDIEPRYYESVEGDQYTIFII